MNIILQKEVQSFFSHGSGFFILGIYAILSGLFLWVFKGDFNILDAGVADLVVFFYLTPLIFMFVIPAITMKSFAEENKTGTMELLITKPFSEWDLVLGKFFGNIIITLIILSISLVYLVTIWALGLPLGNMPIDSTIGSYVGLFFLLGTYTAIGTLTSTFSNHQITAFILGVVCCFILYYGLEPVANIDDSLQWIKYFSLKRHYNSISRGVIDTRDLLYFASAIFVFLKWTHLRVKQTYQ